MSWSERIETWMSSSIGPTALRRDGELPGQVRHPLLEIERRRHVLQPEAELDHREGDLRLDSDDDGLGAAQPDHVRDLLEDARRERVHHLQRGDVDDDPSRAPAHDLLHERCPQPHQGHVANPGLEGDDEDVALLEDRDVHCGGRVHVAAAPTSPTLYPSSRSACSIPPCRSPTVFIFPRSTPIFTIVCAISGESPVTMTVAPRSREASTVCTRWFATVASIAATPVMSMTTTFARLLRMPRNSCSVS